MLNVLRVKELLSLQARFIVNKLLPNSDIHTLIQQVRDYLADENGKNVSGLAGQFFMLLPVHDFM